MTSDREVHVELQPARLEEKPALRQLLELYSYDFSEFSDDEVDEHGLFGYPYLDHYWTEPDRYPFLVRVNGQLAGLALVRMASYFPDRASSICIAEFFVMRRYRRRGVGTRVAKLLFEHFHGHWEIAQTVQNVAAQAFWRKVISDYTGGDFSETVLNSETWRGPIQEFDNS